MKSNAKTYVCLFHFGWMLQFWASKEVVANTPTNCKLLRCIKYISTVGVEIISNIIDGLIQRIHLMMCCIRKIHTKNYIFPYWPSTTKVKGLFQAAELLHKITEYHVIIKNSIGLVGLSNTTLLSNTAFVTRDWKFLRMRRKICVESRWMRPRLYMLQNTTNCVNE